MDSTDFTINVDGETYSEWFGTNDTNTDFSHLINKGNTASGYVYYDVPESETYNVELEAMPNLKNIKAKWKINKSDIQQANNTYNQPTDESTNETYEESTEEPDNSDNEPSDEIVDRSNVMDYVEDYEGETLDTDSYTFKEPEHRDDGSWGFAYYTKDGELAGSYIVDEYGMVSKFDEDGIEE